MKYWKCPECKRVRKYEEELVMKICSCCVVEMFILTEKEVTQNGN